MSGSPRALDYNTWRYIVLPYCDLGSLLRVAWTCTTLRNIVQHPSFVVEWQTQCWYLYRDCCCDRNQFYQQVTPWCPFVYDYTPPMDNQWEARLFLRHHGRGASMLNSLQPHATIRLPYLPEPRRTPDLFHEGVMSTWVDTLLLPVPRMVYVPVEDTVVLPMTHPRTPVETDEEYRGRLFWRGCHSVDQAMERKINQQPPLPTLFQTFGSQHREEHMLFRDHTKDAVAQYVKVCIAEGRDPHDPMDDPNLEGHEAVQWARRRMYESCVGNQSYPYELCLRRTELEPPYAHLHGVDYIERLFLSLEPVMMPMQSMTDHRGVAFWTGIRYNNESGDFVNWVLAQWSLQNAVYIHLWYDVCYQFLEMTLRWCRQLALELEDDTGAMNVRNRWLRMEHLARCRPCHNIHDRPETRDRDHDTMEFLNRADYGSYFHRLRHALADHTTARCFLRSLVPAQRNMVRCANRTELQLVQDIDSTLELLCFITDVGEYLCNPSGPGVHSMRRRTRSIYLGAGVSLVAFCPHWNPEYSWKPSRTGCMDALTIPRPSLMDNHRYQQYLRFCNARTLFYQPDNESLLARHAQQQDLGKSMEM